MITSQEYDLLLDVKNNSTDEADNRSETISAPFQKQNTGLSTSSDKTTKNEVERTPSRIAKLYTWLSKQLVGQERG